MREHRAKSDMRQKSSYEPVRNILPAPLTVLAQLQMGASWRVGIDDRPTELVTGGLFRVVRNPIFTALLVFLVTSFQSKFSNNCTDKRKKSRGWALSGSDREAGSGQRPAGGAFHKPGRDLVDLQFQRLIANQFYQHLYRNISHLIQELAVIVSGGFGKEGWDEAQVMADYLAARGVPQSAIMIDREVFGQVTARSLQNIIERYRDAHAND